MQVLELSKQPVFGMDFFSGLIIVESVRFLCSASTLVC